jgi:hypothetical protein
MPNDKDKLTKPSASSGSLSKGIRIGVQKTALQQRLEAAAQQRAALNVKQAEASAIAEQEALKKPNRIALLPDCSGSMSETPSRSVGPIEDEYRRLHAIPPQARKIEIELQAVDQFLKDIDFNTTSVAFNGVGNSLKTPLLIHDFACRQAASQIAATGGTPIGEELQFVLENLPITRAVLISDGEKTGIDPIPIAQMFGEAGIPIDAIFIGDSGRRTMELIAEYSGGIFIEFKDVAKLADSLKYLSPKYRAMLTSMSETEVKKLTGASEVKL